MTFDPKAHLIQLKNKDYLETKWRIAWFRDEHPKGQILTEIVSVDPVLIMKAFVQDTEGHILGTGHGTAQAKQGAVWSGREIEKAETAAIGRALGHAGYGTQFTDEDERDNLADSPNTPSQSKSQSKAVSTLGSGSQGRRLPVDAKTPQNAEIGQTATDDVWRYDFQALMKHEDVIRSIEQSNHRAATINILFQANGFDDLPNLNAAAYRVCAYHAFRAAGKSESEAIIEAVSVVEF